MGDRVKRHAAMVAAAAVVGCSSAQAATVIELPASQTLLNGQSHAGTFDISGLLDDGVNKYRAVGATLTVNGTSAFGGTNSIVTGVYTYGYSCGGWWSSRTCYASGAYYSSVDSVQDSLTISAAGIDASGSNSAATVTDYYGSAHNSFYGAMVAQLLLDGTALEGANNSGSLAFSTSALTNTNILLNRISLSVELEQLPTAAAVPEPKTWALMLLGFGAVGTAVRRSNRRARRTQLA